MTIQKGTILIGKSQDEITKAGANGDGIVEGQEYVVATIDGDLIATEDSYQGYFTLTSDENDLSYASFFSVKEA